MTIALDNPNPSLTRSTTMISYPAINKSANDRLLIVTTLRKNNNMSSSIAASVPKTPPEFMGSAVSAGTASSLIFEADPYDVLLPHTNNSIDQSSAHFHSQMYQHHQNLLNKKESLRLSVNTDTQPVDDHPCEYPVLSAPSSYKSAYPTPSHTTPGSPLTMDKQQNGFPSAHVDTASVPQNLQHSAEGFKNKSASIHVQNPSKDRKSRSMTDQKKTRTKSSASSDHDATTPVSAGNLSASFTVQAKSTLYKTEMCRSWEETGTCRYGNKCQFAHSETEIRPVDRHPKYKTEMCRTFWEKGSCPYGKRCCFIHTDKDLFEKKNGIGAIPPNLSAAISPANLSIPNFSNHAAAGPSSAPLLNSSVGSAGDNRISFPEMLPPPHTTTLKDTSSPGFHTPTSILSKSPLHVLSASSTPNMNDSLWRQSPPRMNTFNNMPRQSHHYQLSQSTKTSPFSKPEDSFRQINNPMHTGSMPLMGGNATDIFGTHMAMSGLERSFQGIHLNDSYTSHYSDQLNNKPASLGSANAYKTANSPFSRSLAGFSEEPSLKSFDHMNGPSHSRMMSASSALHSTNSGLGVRNSSNYYTPQFQTMHRFRMDSHNGLSITEEQLWGDNIHPSQGFPNQQNGMSDMNTQMGYMNGSNLPSSTDLQSNIHQRTFSSPAFSLMYDSIEPSSAFIGNSMVHPHYQSSTSNSSTNPSSLRNYSTGLGR